MSGREGYVRSGFTVRRGCFTATAMAGLAAHAERLWNALSRDARAPHLHWRDHATKGRVPDRIDPVLPYSAHFRSIALAPGMVALASELLGEPAAPFKDKLVFKRTGVAGYDLHQDFPYWAGLGAGPEAFVTLLVALDDSGPENGALELFPGLHERILPAPQHDPLETDPAALAGIEPVMPRLARGDVLAFHSLVPHRSGPNRSIRSRRSYFVTYTPAAAGLDYPALVDTLRRTRYQALLRGVGGAAPRRTR